MKNESNSPISILRNKKFTQNLIGRDPVLFTRHFNPNQIGDLIEGAMNQKINLCTRIDIATPNGLHLSGDFRLSPAQIRQVWQVRPAPIDLKFQLPKEWPNELQNPISSNVGMEGLFIDIIEAENYLEILSETAPSNEKNPNFEQKKLKLKLDPNRPSKLGRDKSEIICTALEEIIIEGSIATINANTLWKALIARATNNPDFPFKKSGKNNVAEKDTNTIWDRETATHHIKKVLQWYHSIT